MSTDQGSSMTAETNSNTDASSGTTRPGTDPDSFGPGGVVGQLPDPCAPSQDGEKPGPQLQRLRKCLEDAQRKQKEADSDVQRFTAQVTALASFSDEFEKIVAEYEKAYDDKIKIQNGFEDFQKATESGLEKLLDKDTRDRITATVKPLKDEIIDLEGTKDKYGKPIPGKIEVEEENLAIAKLALAKAIAEREKAKTKFENWRKAVASIGSRHASLKALRKQIEDAADGGEPAFAYWLVSDKDNFTSTLKGPVQVLPVKEFRETLLQFWNDFNAAIKKVQDLDGQVKGSEEALKSMKARLDDAKKNLQARVRVLLSTIPVTPPPPSSSAAGGSSDS